MKTLKQQLRKLNKEQYQTLKDFCHYSNNLYNYTLYVAKEYYKETNKYIGSKELYNEVKDNENFKLLPVQCSQQIIRLIDKDFRGFFALLRRKQKGQYPNNVNSPKFKKKGGTFNLIYTNQNSRLSKKKKTLSFDSSNAYNKLKNKKLTLKIPFSYDIDGEIKQIIIKPINDGQYFNLYITYEENKKEVKNNVNKNKYVAIDLGINNFASFVDSSGRSYLVNGKPLKSYNRQFNKRNAGLKSELEKKNGKKWSRRLETLNQKRYWWIDNYFNQVASKLMKYCAANQIGNLILGYNKNWKQDLNIGKVNNQKFQYIPYYLFKRKLEHKCSEFGIQYVQQEESYTSKCSFLDKEEIGEKENYFGERIKRGLFKSANGIIINADINGSGNILRKVIGDTIYSQPIEGLMLNPVKINFFDKSIRK